MGRSLTDTLCFRARTTLILGRPQPGTKQDCSVRAFPPNTRRVEEQALLWSSPWGRQGGRHVRITGQQPALPGLILPFYSQSHYPPENYFPPNSTPTFAPQRVRQTHPCPNPAPKALPPPGRSHEEGDQREQFQGPPKEWPEWSGDLGREECPWNPALPRFSPTE